VVISPYESLVLTASARPDRLPEAVQTLLKDVFSDEFTLSLDKNPSSILKAALGVHYFVICSKGHDMSHRIETLAKDTSRPLVAIAMGTREGAQQADYAVAQGFRTGSWVLIRNAHLAIAWLQALERRFCRYPAIPEFKLFITAESSCGYSRQLVTSLP